MQVTNKKEGNKIIETKICVQCNKEKLLSDFYSQEKHSKNKGDYIYYHTQCKECCVKNAQQARIINHDKHLEYYKKANAREDKRAKIIQANKERREKGEYRKYLQNNPDKVKQYSLNRQHKNHRITKEEWQACKEYFNNCCAYCEFPEKDHYRMYAGKQQKQDLHKEHVDHNGSNDLSNCIPSCQSCNDHKWKFTLDEFYNSNNPNFTEERYNKIIKWIEEDYKQYILPERPKKKYKKREEKEQKQII